MCVRASSEPWNCENEQAIVFGILDTCLRTPVGEIAPKRLRSRLKVIPAPGHLDDCYPYVTLLFGHGRVPCRGGLLEEGLIYLLMFHTPPGSTDYTLANVR